MCRALPSLERVILNASVTDSMLRTSSVHTSLRFLRRNIQSVDGEEPAHLRSMRAGSEPSHEGDLIYALASANCSRFVVDWLCTHNLCCALVQVPLQHPISSAPQRFLTVRKHTQSAVHVKLLHIELGTPSLFPPDPHCFCIPLGREPFLTEKSIMITLPLLTPHL